MTPTDLTLRTADDVSKAVHDIRQRVEGAAKKADVDGLEAKLGAQFDVMARDLQAASQRLAQMQQAQAYGPAYEGGGDVAFKQFVAAPKREGAAPTLRAYGGETREGGWEPGLLDAQKPINEWHERALQLQQEYTVAATIRSSGKEHNSADLARRAPLAAKRLREHLAAGPASVAKLFGDATGTGGDWIPDPTSPLLDRDLFLARRVEALFPTVQMASKNLTLPFQTRGGRPYKAGASTSDDPGQIISSTIATDYQTVSAVGLKVRYQVDEDASEDSIIAVEALFRAEQVQDLIDATEDLLINGDSDGTHQDTGLAGWDIRSRWGAAGLGTGSDHRNTDNGLRKYAIAASASRDGNTDGQTYAGVAIARSALASPHGLSTDLVILTSPEYQLKMFAFDQVLTVDKMGPSAFILTGQLLSIAGMAVVGTDFVDKQYNGSGIYDNSTKTKTGFLLLNRSRYWMGIRRGTTTEMAKDITRGLMNHVTTRRFKFVNKDEPTAKANVVWSYNLTP
jgi:hypothetical protein